MSNETDIWASLEGFKMDEPLRNDKPLKICAAGLDGECNHPKCPQNMDGEPKKTGRFCPLPHYTDEEDY